MKKLSDEELRAKTQEFREQLALYLKGGLALENELVKLLREALNTVEPQAEHLTDEHLHAAVTEYRQSIEHKRDAERYLKDSLHDTLADCFEKAYELLSPLLNILRARAARELADEREKWPEEAKNPQKATLALLKEIEPTLNDVDPDMANDAFEVAWPHFVAARDAAPDKMWMPTCAWSSYWLKYWNKCSPKLSPSKLMRWIPWRSRWRNAFAAAKHSMISCRKPSPLCARPVGVLLRCATTMSS